VLEGYKPWRKALVCAKGQGCTKVNLADHHQACTRMLRADYCGDGTSYTVDDVEINVYDGLGIRVDSEAWASEAEWDADGALCLSSPRISASQPTCAGALKRASCGQTTSFGSGALLISEYSVAP
jgi:ADYC domain